MHLGDIIEVSSLVPSVTLFITNHVQGGVNTTLTVVLDRDSHSVHVVSLHVLVMDMAVAPQGEHVLSVRYRVVAVDVSNILVDVGNSSSIGLVPKVPL